MNIRRVEPSPEQPGGAHPHPHQATAGPLTRHQARLLALRRTLRSLRQELAALRIMTGASPRPDNTINLGGLPMKCPVCTTVELLLAERQGVEIDYCPHCRGVWLDRGELDKIIDRSFTPQSRPLPEAHPQPSHEGGHRGRHHGHHGDGHGQGHHGKKSWLSELFD